jgi:hypothetical protein
MRAVEGLKHSTLTRGVIPVYIANYTNHQKMLKWIKSLTKVVGTHGGGLTGRCINPVFFIDEVHELYTSDGVDYMLTKGCLKPSPNGHISNHDFIHRVAELCTKRLCGMVGITATPQRLLTTDPMVYPRWIYTMPCIAPAEGLVRVGYSDQNNEFQGAVWHNQTGHLEVISEILSRPHVTLSNGAREIKFLNITTEHENTDMLNLADMIEECYPEQTYVRTFMQANNGGHGNITDLDRFFDLRLVPDEVITNGVMILMQDVQGSKAPF